MNKKILSIISCILSVLLLSQMAIIGFATGDEYANDCVIVVIKNKYTKVGQTFEPKDFDEELVKDVVDLMPMNENDNPKTFHHILQLVLVEPSDENVQKLIEILKSNEIVLNASPNYYYYYAEDTSQRVIEDLSNWDVPKYYGDADLNGEVRAEDARMVLRASAKLDPMTDIIARYCDMDNNGEIRASDARTILRTSAGLEEKRPV